MANKKQVIMSLNSPDEANKKVFMIMEVNEEEYENKISHLKNGNGDGATMTEINLYKARKSGKKKSGYEYELCGEDELVSHFGTVSGDGIMEFYYENVLKPQSC